jgi:hypothetical protein
VDLSHTIKMYFAHIIVCRLEIWFVWAHHLRYKNGKTRTVHLRAVLLQHPVGIRVISTHEKLPKTRETFKDLQLFGENIEQLQM